MQLFLINETRAKCWRAWRSLPPVLILLFFIQTVSGRLHPEAPRAWAWLLAGLLPGLAVLWGSMWLNRHPAKLIQQTLHQALVGGSWFYLALLVLTPLAEPFAQMGGQSTVEFLQTSWLWLLPTQALLVVAYILAFLRKDALFRPDARLISAFAKEKAGHAQNDAQKQAFQLIAAGQLEQALNLVAGHLEQYGSTDHSAVILLQGEWATAVRNRALNLVDPDTAQRQINRITMGLLHLIPALKT